MSMKICYFADGRYIHASRWMKFFANRGHQMHLISFAPMTDEQIEQFEKVGIRYHGTTGNFHLKKFWLTLKDLKFVRSVLKREEIEILHSHFLGANAWFADLSGFHPHIITIMGGGDVVRENWKPDSNLQERFLTPRTLKNADLITAWSEVLARAVKPYCRDSTPIEVVHGGIELGRFQPTAKRRDLFEELEIPLTGKIIFSPRLMRPLSNITQIARAAGKISEVFPETYYIIAYPKAEANKSYSNEVKRIFSENSLLDKVRFISEIPHDKIVDYFCFADVMISIPDTDGTPMTVLESMACGTPTVIGNLADYDKMYFEHEKTTLMVDITDPNSIAEATLQLLQVPTLSEKITSEARKRVKETGSYESQMLKMERLYKDLLQQ
jgi:L-malate glycosyltransferase